MKDSGLHKYHLILGSNFIFLARFSLDHLSHPVIYSFILPLNNFVLFAYYEANRFYEHIIYTCNSVAYLGQSAGAVEYTVCISAEG